MTKWWEQAACVGLPIDLFFPESMSIHKWDEGKKVCEVCPVRQECLDLAMDVDELEDRWGIFGGLSPSERLELRRKKSPTILKIVLTSSTR